MGSTIAGVATVLTLGVWHRRTGRHANWHRSPDARRRITFGYPFVAMAVYWLAQSGGLGWEWGLGTMWALVAMVLFIQGFDALNEPPDDIEKTPTAASGHGVSPQPSVTPGIAAR
ncbi:hypothetical protein M2272_003435 [Mycobacterium frederiksbergense]|uniref:Uncharacterized protein n=1 Tax=Mycolicibacterium frederiksbergense TaxID=117567 RepID=A0ABT6L1G0_9MYCO|nr:hypothetical protein [Mycolicibacterium frederiksbergense]MDH6196782.1 hypothetical protein [Mycolicibacterium frederiksbergense]